MKKGSPSNSLPKTFCYFSQTYPRFDIDTIVHENLILIGDMSEKNSKKSLERGLGKNLSLERFAPVISADIAVNFDLR